MKKLIIFSAAITLSSAVFAGSLHKSNSGASMMMGGDMSSMNENTNSKRDGMDEKTTQAEILKNKEMQRLHKEMTLYGLSERGMEARRMMIGTEAGKAYHQALERDQKNAAE
ncbi:hypothetical protein [Marinobacter sp.]|uniref:hypothetical protein n=1 Tax=Marinobacter sp. TaxID=50741 RepID=UPI001B59FC57|nr:hypothetical protein [Marinobacter sp.]MBQ0832659.1 hypothetical protein [Marinobacter sp.]